MAELKITLDEFAGRIAELVAERLADGGPATKTAAKKTGKAKVEDEPEDEDGSEEEADGDLDERIEELKGTNIRTLRKMAIELGFDEEEVADETKDNLSKAIAEAEAEDADGEDEDEEAEGEEDEGYTEAELKKKTLVALKKIAKDEYEWSAADLKGYDKNDLIAALLGDEDEDAEDEEEAYTEEDLAEMSLAELKAICTEYQIKVPRGSKQADLIELILAEGEEEAD